MDLAAQRSFLEKILPEGKSFIITASIHHCCKCHFKCEVLKPCPKCGNKDHSGGRFPQGKREVVRDGELVYEDSKILPSGFVTTCFGWKIPWKDIQNNETGLTLVQWAYLREV